MARSLKKGPYVHYSLEKEDPSECRIWKEDGYKNLVQGFYDNSGFRWPDHSCS